MDRRSARRDKGTEPGERSKLRDEKQLETYAKILIDPKTRELR